MKDDAWFAAKCIFKHAGVRVSEKKASLYEERIVLVRAHDEQAAIVSAEREAIDYVGYLEGVEFLRYTMVFRLFEEKIENFTELFSVMRESPLSSDEYIDRHYDTDSERTT